MRSSLVHNRTRDVTLQNMDPHFDFDAAIAPVPQAVRGDLAHWVEDNVEALIRAFALDNDDAIVAAVEGSMVNGPDAADGDADSDGGFSDASNGPGGAPEDASVSTIIMMVLT